MGSKHRSHEKAVHAPRCRAISTAEDHYFLIFLLIVKIIGAQIVAITKKFFQTCSRAGLDSGSEGP
jgi:nitrate reductase gamma subunit